MIMNPATMKKYFLRTSAFVVLTIVIGAITAGPSIAQVIRAALVKNIDEKGRNPYQSTGVCNVFGRCFFEQVPAGKRLIIEFVSLDVDSRDGTLPTFPAAAVFEASTGGASSTIPIYQRFGTDFGANTSVFIYSQPGETPLITVIGGNSLTVNTATITGYLVDLAS
jgi:hypothetical protein